jgi:hypothetical protein
MFYNVDDMLKTSKTKSDFIEIKELNNHDDVWKSNDTTNAYLMMMALSSITANG